MQSAPNNIRKIWESEANLLSSVRRNLLKFRSLVFGPIKEVFLPR